MAGYKTKNKELERRWDLQVRRRADYWHSVFAWTVIVIYPAWSLFDYFVGYPGWEQFMYIRLAGSALILVVLAVVKIFNLHAFWTGYVVCLTMFISIAYMLPRTGDLLWVYSLGYTSAFIGAGMLLHWPVKHWIIVILISFGAYIFFFMQEGQHGLSQVVGGGASLTWTVAFISVILTWNRLRMARNELLVRMEYLDLQHELQESLRKSEELKTRQDGDYFLTSMLLEPLVLKGGNQNNVSTDFIIKQKKNFPFKGKNHEIGGDLCITDSVTLRSRVYTVFLNGDAMGKSIQGAGGAIVLGVIFRSLLSRLQSNLREQSLYPEEWLDACSREMQGLFAAFDCSMMVSVVLGLVNQRNGFMYHINAEHPLTVLYRDGKSTFLPTPHRLPKLGSPLYRGGGFRNLQKIDAEYFTRVNTYQMRSGDTLISGSDGRDDILLKTGSAHDPIINEDENMFLKIVDESAGKIENIEEHLKERGIIMDDVSLLSLGYTGPEPRDPTLAPELALWFSRADNENERSKLCAHLEGLLLSEPGNTTLLELLIRLYSRARKFRRAAQLGEVYVEYRPGENAKLYETAWLFRKAGLFEKAAHLANLLRLRDPENRKNLRLLAYCLYQENHPNLKNFLNHARELAPEDRSLKSPLWL